MQRTWCLIGTWYLREYNNLKLNIVHPSFEGGEKGLKGKGAQEENEGPEINS